MISTPAHFFKSGILSGIRGLCSGIDYCRLWLAGILSGIDWIIYYEPLTVT